MNERHVRRPQRPVLYFALLAAAVFAVAGSALGVARIAAERAAPAAGAAP